MKESNNRNIRIIYRNGSEKDMSITREGQQKRFTNSEKTTQQRPILFEGKLDFRDQIIRIPLAFSISKERYTQNPSIYESQILDWLVNVVENILSITFRYILEQKLAILEGKAFAAKNILLNLKELCEYIHNSVEAQVNQHLIDFLDTNLTEIISQVINKYPQTNAKTASKKILKLIKKYSNMENDNFDLLHTHNFIFKYKNNGDYSSEIMEIVNKILNVPLEQTNQDETMMDEFKYFCRRLFFYSHSGLVAQTKSVNPHHVDQSIDAYLNILEPGKSTFQNLDENEQLRIKSERYKAISQELVSEDHFVTSEMLQFQKMKAGLFLIGQKIPSEVKTFTQRQIRQGQFRVYHSSILRVLTKWSQQLYGKLERADELIRARIHKFKVTSGGKRFCSLQEKQILYQQALKQKIKIDQYLQNLKNQNKILQSAFSIEYQEGKYAKKFTNINGFVGKLEEIVTQYTFRYLNQLIHSLLRISISAGQKLYENYSYLENKLQLAEQRRKDLSDINIVTCKVGDLIRAKFSCSECEFSNILGILYKLEEVKCDFLKIIKIKNRMFDKDNDILINFFFHKKIICELQLSIHKQENKKEKLYSEFNHFIYQLKRSQFGIISQLSSIIAQHDPIVNYFTFGVHKPPIMIEKPKKRVALISAIKQQNQIFKKMSDPLYINRNISERSIERPFICSTCKSLKTVLNYRFYYRQEQENVCNECIENRLYMSPNENKDILKCLFKYYILDEYQQQFLNYVKLWNPLTQLKNIKDEMQLYVDFIDFGFIIQKGDKLPKVKFFKTFYNNMNNTIVLTTINNGELDNFLHFNCKKEKNKFMWKGQMEKYLFFSVNTKSNTSLKSIGQTYISEQYCGADYFATLNLNERQVLKKQYIQEVLSSFEKYLPTLYLNGYKYVMEYLYEYLHSENQSIRKRTNKSFQEGAVFVNTILLQSSQIFTIYPLIDCFVNLRDINLSNNKIKSVKQLQRLEKIESINISNNSITTLQPLTKMPWIKIIDAYNNEIQSLEEINLITSLKSLNVRENKISQIHSLEGLELLQTLILSKNTISSMQGINKLKSLTTLVMSFNFIIRIENIQQLQHLEALDLSYNIIEEMTNFANKSYLKILNLSKNSILKIKQTQAVSLTELNLSGNNIDKIEQLQNLTQLTFLNLSYNKISKMQGLSTLVKLKKLYVTHNKIIKIESLETLKNLQQFKFDSNPIEEIQNINHLRNLQGLYLESCSLKDIEMMNKLKKLKLLSISHNEITKISEINELVKLQRLDLSYNMISKIENMGTLKYLQNLTLEKNYIRKIENLEQLIELIWLSLSKNQIEKIEGLDNLCDLRLLNLQENSITHISGLDFLQNLQQLILSSNSIQQVTNLDKLANLKKISLSNNRIAKIQGLSSLTNLELLDLQMNQITKIEGLSQLKELKWLVLSINRIEVIEQLSKVEQLENLFLSQNKIKKVGDLTMLRQLQILYLDHNEITEIQGFSDSMRLEKLNLGFNQISRMEKLQGLTQLEQLNLEHNSISKIENLDLLIKLKVLILADNKIGKIEGLDNLRLINILNIQKNQVKQVEGIQHLHFLNEINFQNNPISNSMQSFNDLKDNIKLCIDLVIQKFDSVNLKKTNQNRMRRFDYPSIQNFSSQNLPQSDNFVNVNDKVKLIKLFTTNFQAQS